MSRALDDFLHAAFAPLAKGEQVFLSNAYIKWDGEFGLPAGPLGSRRAVRAEGAPLQLLRLQGRRLTR